MLNSLCMLTSSPTSLSAPSLSFYFLLPSSVPFSPTLTSSHLCFCLMSYYSFRYPHALFFLDRLQEESFRKELINASFVELLWRQQFNHWRYPAPTRLSPLLLPFLSSSSPSLSPSSSPCSSPARLPPRPTPRPPPRLPPRLSPRPPPLSPLLSPLLLSSPLSYPILLLVLSAPFQRNFYDS